MTNVLNALYNVDVRYLVKLVGNKYLMYNRSTKNAKVLVNKFSVLLRSQDIMSIVHIFVLGSSCGPYFMWHEWYNSPSYATVSI